jgi:hypothetical protein
MGRSSRSSRCSPTRHGGDLNRFFLIKGDPSKLDALQTTDDWIRHTTRASLHLEGFGTVRGVVGSEGMRRFQIWSSLLPK